MKIKEVSEKYNVTADTLRYYEKIGLLDHVTRQDNGIRDFQESDLKRLEFILCMRSAGLSVASLQKYVELFHEGDETIMERKGILVTQADVLKEKIAELEGLLSTIEFKITNYESKLLTREKELLKITEK